MLMDYLYVFFKNSVCSTKCEELNGTEVLSFCSKAKRLSSSAGINSSTIFLAGTSNEMYSHLEPRLVLHGLECTLKLTELSPLNVIFSKKIYGFI